MLSFFSSTACFPANACGAPFGQSTLETKGGKPAPPAFCGDTIEEDQSDFSEILARGTGIGAVRSRGSITPLVCFLPKS